MKQIPRFRPIKENEDFAFETTLSARTYGHSLKEAQ